MIGVVFFIAGFTVNIPCLNLYFQLNGSSIDKIVRYVSDGHAIYEMSTCYDGNCIASINEVQIDCFPQKKGIYIPASCMDGVDYLEVLASENIDSISFHQFLKTFLEQDCELIKKEEDYVLLLRKGNLGTNYGYLFSISGKIPEVGSKLAGYYSVSQVSPLEDNWFNITTYEYD